MAIVLHRMADVLFNVSSCSKFIIQIVVIHSFIIYCFSISKPEKVRVSNIPFSSLLINSNSFVKQASVWYQEEYIYT